MNRTVPLSRRSAMADYFLLLDANAFEGRIRPALAESWRRRSFESCRALWADLAPAAEAFAERCHAAADDSLLFHAACGLPFSRAAWRGVVGETLLYSASEIPELQTCEDVLCHLLAPMHVPDGAVERDRLAPIQQAHRGSRDLTFGPAVYRPEHAGYDSVADMARLADYLASVRPEDWTTDALSGLPDAADELDFAREWFPALADLYRGARDRRQVVVHECIF